MARSGQQGPSRRAAIGAGALLAAASLAAGPPPAPTITFRNTVPLPAETTDQNGDAFAIAGVSGITLLPDGRFAAAMDNSDKIIFIDVALQPDGAIASAAVQGGLTLAAAHDYEGIAPGPANAAPTTVWLCEEDTPALHRFDLATGAHIETLDAPAVFMNIRPNFGLESLARRSRPTARLWTANEAALVGDGEPATPTGPTPVRLLAYAPGPDGFAPNGQWVYIADPLHGSAVSGARSGLVDLVHLPGGALIALERSFAFNLGGFFRTRIYAISLEGATDVTDIPALDGASYTPVEKVLLYQGQHNNLEGLALGPTLGPGRWSLIGVVDDGDPISTGALVAFELAGVRAPVPVCRGDLDTDGDTDTTDLNILLSGFGCGGDGCAGDLDHDGDSDSTDLNILLSAFGIPCR